MNTFVNAQIETKKLKLYTPDANGKTKSHFLHIGKESKNCPELEVHGTAMERVSEDIWATSYPRMGKIPKTLEAG